MQPRTMRTPESSGQVLGISCLIAALFHGTAVALGSNRGEAGIVVAALVVGATLIVESRISGQHVFRSMQSLGLGASHRRAFLVSVVLSLLMLLVIPIYARATASTFSFDADALWLLPGLFAQGGIAEETLFRGFVFGRLRRGRGFWRAAALSTLPFAAIHVILFATLPLAVAFAALLLSVVVSFPLARLFELGGGTIWAPALLHSIVQGTIKVLAISGDEASAFPVVWMLASALVPLLAFLVPRASRS